MAQRLRRFAILGAVILAMLAARPARAVDVTAVSKWQFEELRLKSGRVLRGLIESETDEAVDFTEIRRPPGRPMFLIMQWQFPRDKIDKIERLPEDKRHELTDRIADFRNRAQDDVYNLANVQIERTGSDAHWHYASPLWLLPDKSAWLLLDSTAEEETTRRSIVRIEQVFAAFAEILPPRTRPTRPLHIKLFGTMKEHRAFLESIGLRVGNPDVFVAGDNLLAAGSELSAYEKQLAEARAANAAVRAQLNAAAAQMPGRLAELQTQLAVGGVGAEDRRKAVQLAKANWAREFDARDREIKAADRKNDEQFDKVTERMFARLFHGAFHVYLENYVYPHSSYDVPRWLNEGLAQVFESGQIESGALRLDAPHAGRLKQLQDDLRKTGAISAARLSLKELLSADASRFLVSGTQEKQETAASQRYYLYSWGLAYYLTFRLPRLETKELDRYVAQTATPVPPVERFEKLVGMPLDKFEARWREEMLRMKSDGK